MKITVLGSGGWIPTSSRQTSCYLITSGTEALVLDAGTGLGALHLDPSLLDGVETVTVLLSHFHLDHVTGLGFVSGRGLGDREVTIAGPGAVSYDCPTRSIVEGRLLESPFQTTSPVASARWAELGRDAVSSPVTRSKHGSRPDTPCPRRVSGSETGSPIAPTPNSTRRPSATSRA